MQICWLLNTIIIEKTNRIDEKFTKLNFYLNNNLKQIII